MFAYSVPVFPYTGVHYEQTFRVSSVCVSVCVCVYYKTTAAYQCLIQKTGLMESREKGEQSG